MPPHVPGMSLACLLLHDTKVRRKYGQPRPARTPGCAHTHTHTHTHTHIHIHTHTYTHIHTHTHTHTHNRTHTHTYTHPHIHTLREQSTCSFAPPLHFPPKSTLLFFIWLSLPLHPLSIP